MPTELVPRTFDASCVPSLAAFDCGADRFGKIATDWIRCVDDGDSALQAMTERQTHVILYYTPANELVGFGSLGKTTRRIKKVVEEWSIIPHVGIARQYRNCPQGVPWYERYSATIMIDLMSLARDHNTPTLMLKVHQDNTGAMILYDRLGFRQLGHPNSAGYVTMTIENHD